MSEGIKGMIDIAIVRSPAMQAIVGRFAQHSKEVERDVLMRVPISLGVALLPVRSCRRVKCSGRP